MSGVISTIAVIALFWIVWKFRYKWQTDIDKLFPNSQPKFNNILRKTRINGFVVSTVRLPIVESMRRNPILLEKTGYMKDGELLEWETQVFLPSGDSVEECRYSNQKQAEAGHRNLVGKYSFKRIEEMHAPR